MFTIAPKPDLITPVQAAGRIVETLAHSAAVLRATGTPADVIRRRLRAGLAAGLEKIAEHNPAAAAAVRSMVEPVLH